VLDAFSLGVHEQWGVHRLRDHLGQRGVQVQPRLWGPGLQVQSEPSVHETYGSMNSQSPRCMGLGRSMNMRSD
jgi:hypothetical protein